MIDKSKTYQTRNGRKVRIYATDGREGKPVHGAVFEDGWVSYVWTADGFILSSHASDYLQYFNQYDLIEVVPLIERWAVIRKTDGRCIGTYKCLPEANVCMGGYSDEYRIVHLREVLE